jgi:serine/threonine protein kinase
MLASLPNDRNALVDFRPYASSADTKVRDAAETQAQRLAAILRYAKPSLMHILPCTGLYHDLQNHRFALLYGLPAGVDPSNVLFLDKLITKERRYSLSKRLEIARSIAAAVFVTHSVQWVHRAVQSRRILIFARDGIASGEAYLSGFELARDQHAISSGTEFGSWEDRLYRHPDRQAEQDNPSYVPAYDIYSLGVVLLEIARWKTCASEVDKKGERVFEQITLGKDFRGTLIKKFLPGLAHHVGETYSDVVRDCLTVERGQGMKMIGDILTRLERLQDAI